MITDTIIQSSGLDPKNIPLETGAYEGDSDMTKDWRFSCKENQMYFCTRLNEHEGLHIAHRLDGKVIARWK